MDSLLTFFQLDPLISRGLTDMSAHLDSQMGKL